MLKCNFFSKTGFFSPKGVVPRFKNVSLLRPIGALILVPNPNFWAQNKAEIVYLMIQEVKMHFLKGFFLGGGGSSKGGVPRFKKVKCVILKAH